jgi:hypothetical protein
VPRAQLEATVGGATARFDIDYEEVRKAAGPGSVAKPGETAVAKLDTSLEVALAQARPAAEAVIDTFHDLGPDVVEAEFGLRVDAEAGAVFAKAGAGAHFTIKLKWNAPERAHPAG